MRTVMARVKEGKPFQLVSLVKKGDKNSRVAFEEDGRPEKPKIPNEQIDWSTLNTACMIQDSSRDIPITPLRHFYLALRSNSLQRPTYSLLHADGGAELVCAYFDESVKIFSSYRNIDEPYYDPKSPRKIRALGEKSRFAHDLVAKLKDMREMESCKFIDYEISPWRTTKGKFKGFGPATKSGTGGIDLLLQAKDHTPIVGEIKAETESVSVFFGLIQALTYAAELVTSNQWSRLKKHYKQFDGLGGDPRVDVYLIEEKSSVGADDGARAFAERLLRIDSQLKKHIRKIAFVQAHWEKTGIVSLIHS